MTNNKTNLIVVWKFERLAEVFFEIISSLVTSLVFPRKLMGQFGVNKSLGTQVVCVCVNSITKLVNSEFSH